LLGLGLIGGQLGIDSASLSQETRSRWIAWLPGPSVSKVLLGAGAATIVQQIALWHPYSGIGQWVARFGTWAAAFSFSLYLTHWPLLFLLGRLGLSGDSTMTMSAFAKFALVFAASLLVAWCSYWAFESRTLVVRTWIKRQLGRHAQPSLVADRPA
jgi:peptidoglycan/LPS O-acetylase OafA/YrhL